MIRDTDAAAIKATAERWATTFQSGDLGKLVVMYTEDARLLPNGSDAVIGRDAIFEFSKATQGSETPDVVQFANFAFYGAGSVVTECSDFTMSDPEGKLKMRRKQILLRMYQAGEWLIHRDIWTTNGPLGAV
ncbi:MAG TPA: SgcJ/EcaC family oxidoreductase [Gemmatimonadaceae bacterium]|jgi:uncharacterized protein (TIGR02246 family)